MSSKTIQQKRPNRQNDILLQHDNTHPHIANSSYDSRTRIGSAASSSIPPYSPDLMLSAFHLFQPLLNGLCGISFNNDVELRAWLGKFFDPRPGDFYCRGIGKLIE
ncbi:histone-lysine N-methyltransferase SETMAR-like [Octopus bimaculoides]|uniref:histone-lysine N-methyltransferase SETMAR-like n=1 Tax=Octopus bimaculoides TaxID=37653 RepID=UPI00071CCD32|nr:histone-lysine N-methyltransferase SETMAR-like [Octopus bimaculoides]|eukprot:XP_014787410.1 PREDICTED: histone-lysine N-methyltransferase SETMAR-like [Octopus bimaculoides]